MRALLVVNPHARRGRQFGDVVRAELARRGIQTVERASGTDDVDAVVVAGGDGTLARQIGTALERDVPIGLVPLGTFNDLARTLRVPFDVERACAVIAEWRTRAIDVARVNGAYYVNEASVGLSSRLTRLQRESDKQRFGLLAIAASALQAVKHLRPFHVQVSYDGKRQEFKTVQLTVANSNHFGGFITVDDAAVDDGWLDLYSVDIDRFSRVLPVVVAMFSGKRRPGSGVRAYRASAFDVATRRPRRITADGEPAGTTPASFEILRRSLRLFVPRDVADQASEQKESENFL
jgi:diacylglycerol kinase (ATP)